MHCYNTPMKRTRRYIFNTLTVVSVLLLLATAGLWRQSYFTYSVMSWSTEDGSVGIVTINACLRFYVGKPGFPLPIRFRYTRESLEGMDDPSHLRSLHSWALGFLTIIKRLAESIIQFSSHTGSSLSSSPSSPPSG